jgi:hypothetical protein
VSFLCAAAGFKVCLSFGKVADAMAARPSAPTFSFSFLTRFPVFWPDKRIEISHPNSSRGYKK